MDIKKSFEKFTKEFLANYGIGKSEIYDNINTSNIDQYCLNPYLKTEDDLKVKFGGFLELELIRSNEELTVHSELHIYKSSPQERADLTVNKVSKNELWLKREDILKSLVAAIEIKYANYITPDYDFEKDLVQKDIKKLASLDSNVEKYLLILDEGLKIKPEFIAKTRGEAEKRRIVVLSNNDLFYK